MTNREKKLLAIKSAAASGDTRTATRLIVESRINFPIAMAAYKAGMEIFNKGGHDGRIQK